VGDARFALTVQHWINDFLMVVFFFVVGLEIKRELVAGQLSTFRKARCRSSPPWGNGGAGAALRVVQSDGGRRGGMGHSDGHGHRVRARILALFGSRVPIGLKVFLTALAIVDDLGAVLVIAIFYTHGIHWPGLCSRRRSWRRSRWPTVRGSATRSSTSRWRSASGPACSRQASTRPSPACSSPCWCPSGPRSTRASSSI